MANANLVWGPTHPSFITSSINLSALGSALWYLCPKPGILVFLETIYSLYKSIAKLAICLLSISASPVNIKESILDWYNSMVFSIAPACLCPNDNSAPATAAFNGEPEEATSLAVCVLGGVAPWSQKETKTWLNNFPSFIEGNLPFRRRKTISLYLIFSIKSLWLYPLVTILSGSTLEIAVLSECSLILKLFSDIVLISSI